MCMLYRILYTCVRNFVNLPWTYSRRRTLCRVKDSMRVSMETRAVVAVLWTLLCLQEYKLSFAGHTGIDIGYPCRADTECIAGNGGEYSKCNKRLSICICTISHLAEDKCNKDCSDDHSCRPKPLYDVHYCDTECSPKGTVRWKEKQDVYWNIPDPFTSIFIHDKQTSVCYDPKRAINSVPDGFELKTSTIPGAGLGIFTNIYIQKDTVFGPYKGVFEPEDDIAVESGYSWKILPDIYSEYTWVDAQYIDQSNWLRYVNTPITAEAENVVAIQYQGEMFYQAFKSIRPGTELFVWYGDGYGTYLGITTFTASEYYTAQSGYAGGTCDEEDIGNDCVNDKNTICVDKTCFCKPGTHNRAGICIFDGALGGICNVNDDVTCKLDMNAECEKGVCVCKKGSSPANGMCLRDETAGGRCTGVDGQVCLLDAKTECFQGVCSCIYGTSAIEGICFNDEIYQGRCYGEDDTICVIDKHAICVADICVCAANSSALYGVCVPEETAGGRCSGQDGQRCLIDTYAECVDGLCACIRGTSAVSGVCVMDENLGGQCTSIDGTPCRLNIRTMCQQGICVCTTGSTNLNGTCRTDGGLMGLCIDGECNGDNVVCNTNTNICGCPTSYVSYGGLCVKEK